MAVNPQWVDVLARAVQTATVDLPRDVVQALRGALGRETSDLARLHLETLLEDERVARENGLPICQDTGTPVFFVRAGVDSPWLRDVPDALVEAVRAATEAVPLRPSAIHPFTDENVGNVGRGVPVIDWDLVPGREIEITYVAKGGGSENASGLLFVQPGGGAAAVLRRSLGARRARRATRLPAHCRWSRNWRHSGSRPAAREASARPAARRTPSGSGRGRI